jgi:plasmid stabilization system protein ParE
MTSYFLSPAAEQDIEEIVSFLAEENPRAAFTLLDEVYEAMDTLACNPAMGYKREYIRNKNIRFWPFSGYRDISNLLT